MKSAFLFASLFFISASAFAYNDVVVSKTLIAVGECTDNRILKIEANTPDYFIPLTYEVVKMKAMVEKNPEPVKGFLNTVGSALKQDEFKGFTYPAKTTEMEKLKFEKSETSLKQCQIAEQQLKYEVLVTKAHD